MIVWMDAERFEASANEAERIRKHNRKQNCTKDKRKKSYYHIPLLVAAIPEMYRGREWRCIATWPEREHCHIYMFWTIIETVKNGSTMNKRSVRKQRQGLVTTQQVMQRSSTPTGVGGGAEEAGDVDVDEYDGEASGVSEGGEYIERAWVVHGGEGWR
ncbi:hypothetical protein EDD17DRAFT_1505590 [Pisolithus thermaeus]|nr:hypothetical protein EDD17DRAFT_1505590 [Pisolithus thermaeus]